MRRWFLFVSSFGVLTLLAGGCASAPSGWTTLSMDEGLEESLSKGTADRISAARPGADVKTIESMAYGWAKRRRVYHVFFRESDGSETDAFFDGQGRRLETFPARLPE
ncbi:MAG: hypothetical protein KDM91_13825 [Verrucomicrobiae bacterium]|nr:hypothetical protein [Verrucomicrobiae bacterium]